jgi:hypothetical protein
LAQDLEHTDDAVFPGDCCAPTGYDAWQNKHGDFSDVPLADDFAFTGPVASFDTADGYRAMVAEAGAAVFSRRWRSDPEPSGPDEQVEGDDLECGHRTFLLCRVFSGVDTECRRG